MTDERALPPFGTVGITLNAATAPLVEALQKLGKDIGSVSMNKISQMVGSPIRVADDARVVSVIFNDDGEAARFLKTLVLEMDIEAFIDIWPVAVLHVDARAMLVFLGAAAHTKSN